MLFRSTAFAGKLSIFLIRHHLPEQRVRMNHQPFTCNLSHKNRDHGNSSTRISMLPNGRRSLCLLPQLFFPILLGLGALSEGTVWVTWGAPSLIVIPFSLLFFAVDCTGLTGGPWSIATATFNAACLSFSTTAF